MKLSEHFRSEEFSCKCGCGFDTVDSELIAVLEEVRNHYNKPVHINSGCRCPKRNKEEGGEEDSQHLLGKAADIVVIGVDEKEVASYLENKYPNTYGIGRYKGRTHVDVRKKRSRWMVT